MPRDFKLRCDADVRAVERASVFLSPDVIVSIHYIIGLDTGFCGICNVGCALQSELPPH